MREKIFSYIMIFMLLLSIPFGYVYADGEISKAPSVVDNAELLTDEQKNELDEKLRELQKKYGIDIAIYTANSMTKTTVQAEADDLYDYNGYGIGDDFSGIMYYICMNPRKYAFTTCGEAINLINDDALYDMDSECLPKLKDNDYYGAFKKYIEECDRILKITTKGKTYEPKKDILIPTLLIIFLPLVIAFFSMSAKMSGMKTVVKQDNARNYIKSGSMELTKNSDIFVFSNTYTRRLPENTGGSRSSGGGSSTHISSSGRSHGGRSGSF